MIEIAHEHLLRLRDVPKLLPLTAKGKRVHLSAVYRWSTGSGVRNTTLETIVVGGVRLTSVEAVQRFAERLSTHTLLCVNPTPKRRELALNRVADRVADELGLPKNRPNSDQSATAHQS